MYRYSINGKTTYSTSAPSRDVRCSADWLTKFSVGTQKENHASQLHRQELNPQAKPLIVGKVAEHEQYLLQVIGCLDVSQLLHGCLNLRGQGNTRILSKGKHTSSVSATTALVSGMGREVYWWTNKTHNSLANFSYLSSPQNSLTNFSYLSSPQNARKPTTTKPSIPKARKLQLRD